MPFLSIKIPIKKAASIKEIEPHNRVFPQSNLYFFIAVVVKLSVNGINGANIAQLVIAIKDMKNREFMKFKEKSNNMTVIGRKNIVSLLSPYLSPISAKKGLEKSFIKTEQDRIIAI